MTEESNKTEKVDSTERFLRVTRAVAVLLAILGLGWFLFNNATAANPNHPFKLGLDLAGGSHLVYEADVSDVEPAKVGEYMDVLREVLEKRVNPNGVTEATVQLESSGLASGSKSERVVIELPGVKDVSQAVADIGETPLLEFKLIDQEVLDGLPENASSSAVEAAFVDTGLTGRYLESAALEFAGGQGGQLSNEPIVSIVFNSEGADLFEEITRQNVGENLAIFLDGVMISSPRVNEAITGGRAIISGGFAPEEAKALAQNLNFGALPVPIELVSTQTIGASLGNEVLNKGIEAGLIGFSLVVAFMLFWYRLPGLVAAISLVSYITIMLSLFLLIPVTLTAAGLAGFILSLGMAVDANVLVFERMKEGYRAGKNSLESAHDGFAKAWSAIRDGNITSLLSAIILFWFGTALVKGFAVVFGLGVIVSMFSAIVITRTLLLALPERKKSDNTLLSRLYNSGL